MRDLHDIQVLRGVTHIISPRDPATHLRLSEAELTLGDGVGEILAAHVDGGVHDSQAKAAAFTERGETDACGASRALLAPDPDLVAISQALARTLYAIAERDERVSDGTLATLLCQGTLADGTSLRFPALVKLDPSATLHTVTDTEPETGRTRIRYEVDHTSLPSKNEKVQKCAFVRAINQDLEYELLVVDRQRTAETVGTFWVRDFLGARLVLDSPERTKRLYRALKAARNDVEQELPAVELAALDQVIAGAVVQASVDLDELMTALPVSDAIRARIDASVSTQLPDRAFALDQGVARQFVRRRIYRGDNDLRVSASPEFFSQMVHVEDLEPGNDQTRLRKVWFETRTWKET